MRNLMLGKEINELTHRPLARELADHLVHQATIIAALLDRRCQRPYFVALRTFIDGTVPSLMALGGRNCGQHWAR
jgi:hypothetical protein